MLNKVKLYQVVFYERPMAEGDGVRRALAVSPAAVAWIVPHRDGWNRIRLLDDDDSFWLRTQEEEARELLCVLGAYLGVPAGTFSPDLACHRDPAH